MPGGHRQDDTVIRVNCRIAGRGINGMRFMKKGFGKLNISTQRFRANSVVVVLCLIALVAVIAGLAVNPVIDAGAELKVQLYTDGTYRQRQPDDSSVITLTGKIPQGTTARAYPVQTEETGEIYAAYDITLFDQKGQEIQPETGALDVRIETPAIREAIRQEMQLEVCHIPDEGETEVVSTDAASGDGVAFPAESFSVYVIKRHDTDGDEKIVTPRVTFHFISNDYTDNQDGTYTASFYQFRNKEMKYQTSQVIRSGGVLEPVENPPNIPAQGNEKAQYFYGWYVVNETEVTSQSVTYEWTNEPQVIHFESPISVSLSEDQRTLTWEIDGLSRTEPAGELGSYDVYLAPIYTNYYFVNFYLYPDDPAYPENHLLTRKMVALGADNQEWVRIGDVESPSPDAKHKVFYGWEDVTNQESYITHDDEGKEKSNLSGKNGYYILCTKEKGSIDLYPIFKEARWFTFNVGTNGNGASYIGARYLLTNDDEGDGNIGSCFEALPVPTRNGYRFDGWYTEHDAENNGSGYQLTYGTTGTDQKTVAFTGDYEYREGGKLFYEIRSGKLFAYKAITATDQSDGVTFYAKWTEIPDTSYSVILWKQKLPDGTGSEQNYDYVASYTVQSRSGLQLSDLNLTEYENKSYTGFHHERTQMSTATVQGDGKTIVNIYYNRNQHTLQFYDSSTLVKTITALYEEDISGNFPIVGTDGTTYDNGERWKPSNSVTYSEVLVYINIMPDEDVRFSKNTSSNSTKHLYYYVESLPDETVDVTRNGINYTLKNHIRANYGFFTEKEDYMNFVGCTKAGSDPAFDSSGQIRNKTEVRFYYTRNSNNHLIFDPNYPDLNQDEMIFTDAAGNAAQQSTSRSVTIKYGINIKQYMEGNTTGMQQTAPYWTPNLLKNYTFEGWYEDATCTQPFEFNSPMPPAADKKIYAKWEPVKYRISIDPNGGVIDHIDHRSDTDYTVVYGNRTKVIHTTFNPDGVGNYNDTQATYFNNTARQTIGEYTIYNNYIEISDKEAEELTEAGHSDQVYYYMVDAYDADREGSGIYPDLRNALYLTESQLHQYHAFYIAVMEAAAEVSPEKYGSITIIRNYDVWRGQYVRSTQKYKRLEAGEKKRYEFQQWYEVLSSGRMSDMPYNFSTPVNGEVSLKAVWRLEGGYTISYQPYFVAENNDRINGEMKNNHWTDPENGGTFANQAKTNVQQQPTNVTVNDVRDDESYIFRGWRVVSMKEVDGETVFTPLEEDTYYNVGDDFVVQQKYATNGLVIYLQAYYEPSDEAFRRPKVSNLTLDANGGYLTDSHSEARLTESRALRWDDTANGSATALLDSTTEGLVTHDQIIFSKFQQSVPIYLKNYASETNHFRHPNHYLLLGFDADSAQGDYIADFPADGIITADSIRDDTVYAVWEPMVYVNLVNYTHGDIQLSLTSSGAHDALYVVNEKKSLYDREAINDISRLVVPAPDTANGQTEGRLILAIPKGAGSQLTLRGTNELGTGYTLKIDGTGIIDEDRTQNPAQVKAKNGESFSFSDTMVVDSEGITVSFTEEKAMRALVLNDNYNGDGTGGDSQEIYFEDSDTAFTLISVKTRPGYEFLGWAAAPSDTVPVYSGSSGWTINDLNSFFGAEESRILYALWKTNSEAHKVRIYKDVPLPGDQNKEFTFEIAFSGEYNYNKFNWPSPYTTAVFKSTDTNVTGSTTFTLRHDQYAELDYTKSERGVFSVSIRQFTMLSDGTVEAAGTSTLKWTYSGNRSFVGFLPDNFQMSVTEQDVSGLSQQYSTALSKTSDNSTDYPLELNSSLRKVSWEGIESSGGWIVFTNTRKTSDVYISKTVAPEDNSKHFTFELSVTGQDGYTLPYTSIRLKHQEGRLLEDIPVGAELTITETVDDHYSVLAEADHQITNAQNAGENVFRFTVPDIAADDRVNVSFLNALRSRVLRIINCDENQMPLDSQTYAMPELDMNLILLSSDGVIFGGNTGQALYYGTYTLSQLNSYGEYIPITEPITITVDHSAAGVTADNPDVLITEEYGVYTLRVINRKVVIPPPTDRIFRNIPFILIFLSGTGLAAVWAVRRWKIRLPRLRFPVLLQHWCKGRRRKHGYSAARRNNINKHHTEKEVNAE